MVTPPCAADEMPPHFAEHRSMIGLYAEAYRQQCKRDGEETAVAGMTVALAKLPAAELRSLLIAALSRLADTEDERHEREAARR